MIVAYLRKQSEQYFIIPIRYTQILGKSICNNAKEKKKMTMK